MIPFLPFLHRRYPAPEGPGRPCGPRLPRARLVLEPLEDRAVPSGYEVWAIDQSNSRDENGNGSLLDSVDSGGRVYIYDGADLEGRRADRARPEVIDLGGAARTVSMGQTGSAPIRPHMMAFNARHTHAIIACVGSGHVLFVDTTTRRLVGVVDVGLQAHAAMPAPDDSYVIVAAQNDKKLYRIRTDFRTNSFTLDATLDLAAGTTPSGAPLQDPMLRPDNAPICPVIESTSRFTFVTLRGGGMFVVSTKGPTLSIVGEYDRTAVHPNGCGGVEAQGKMYINAGGGTAANPLVSDLYALPLNDFSTTPNPTPNTPRPRLVFSHADRGFVDSHGAVLTRNGRFLWVADRASNRIVIVDTRTDQVVNEFDLAGPVSADPAPDLMDISPDGSRIFVTLRGTNPLTGNAPGVNNAVGGSPGVGVLRVRQNGRHGEFLAVARISHVLGGVERADPHAIGVRMFDDRELGAFDPDEFEPLAEELSHVLPFLKASAGQPALPPPAEEPRLTGTVVPTTEVGVDPFLAAPSLEVAGFTGVGPERDPFDFGTNSLEDALSELGRLLFVEDGI
jgi:DNA-binding beta-propeller fold protein YncE